ncbi:MAG: hypothetical protein PHO07_16140 [Pirellulales bacterium]|jgi:hypothetical protein|nr:hypothetical protein [Thermoguttaceae bacterium]MDD4788705.1 hypothetical protein [Pirellulales bacterium]MDI9443314.1 hypothetical protein [Planctomycetota bacterium]NLZ02141.1 hypothetical protein [Pirellulaceae bacterium]
MFRARICKAAALMTRLFVLWMVIGGPLLAQEEGGGGDTAAAAASVKGPVWAVAYIVVLVLIGLGTFATVRGSRRRDRGKLVEYEAKVKA